MKKTLVALLVMVMLMLSACGSGQSGSQAAGPDLTVDRERLYVYRDGQLVKEVGYAIGDIASSFGEMEVGEDTYYAASIRDITGSDLGEVEGAFLLASDGYINYTSDIGGLLLASHKLEDGDYKSFELDGKSVYGGVCGDRTNKGVIKVYLVTTPAEFNVDIQVNGQSAGSLTMDDFMKKTVIGDSKVATGFFEGSFLTNYGADSYQGDFLGMDYETMMAKLSSLGIEIDGDIAEVEYYGVNSLGADGKNGEYSTNADSDKYFGIVDFFCMYDGKTFNTDTYETKVGLTAFVNGTGGRWITWNLEKINIITE